MNTLPLSSAAEFSRVRDEWEHTFHEALAEVRASGQWDDWLNASFENCTPDDDSAVVLSKRLRGANVGFSVHICRHDATKPPAFGYERVFGETTNQPIKHFVITTELSPDAKTAARKILVEWLRGRQRD